jgi:lysophospholipase L1-like esterase
VDAFHDGARPALLGMSRNDVLAGSQPWLDVMKELTAAATNGSTVAAGYFFDSGSVTYDAGTGKPASVADSSGQGAPPLTLQDVAGVASVDKPTRILTLRNHWLKTIASARFNLTNPKSVLVGCATSDPGGVHAQFVFDHPVFHIPIPCGIANGVGVNLMETASGSGTAFAHDNAPRECGAAQPAYPKVAVDWGAYGFSVGRSAPSNFRASGFTFVGPNSDAQAGADSFLQVGTTDSGTGGGGWTSKYLGVVVLNGHFNAQQAVIWERFCLANGMANPTRGPLTGTNPQWQTLTAWPAGALHHITFLGDSITAGIGTSGNQHHFDYLVQQTLGNGWAFSDAGINGQTLDAELAANLESTFRNPFNVDDIAVIWLGTNSLYLLDAPGNVAKLKAISLRAWRLGYKPIVVNCLRRTEASSFVGVEAERVAFNAQLAAQWPTFAYALNDMQAAPEFAVVNDAGTANMADGVHPNDAGHIAITNRLLPDINAVALLPWRPI